MDETADGAKMRVCRFLAEHSGRDAESIGLDEPVALFDIDSFEDLEFILNLEVELDVDIPDPTTPWRTVRDIIEFVRSSIQR